jgi:arylsulfatase A-like enzyme
MDNRPHILYFQVDNLGFGELSCYSGGPLRGAWTQHIDAFAGQGFRIINFAPEAQCTRSRSALLTGRYAIRSGTHSVPMGAGGDWGLVQWEQTIGDLLSSAGYCCAAYGKWHVGEGRGRWPTDKASPSGMGLPGPTTRHCGRRIRGMTRAAIRCQRCCPSSAAKQMSQKVNNSPSTSGATATTSISPKRTGSFGPR